MIGSVIFHSPGELQASVLAYGSWRRPPTELLVEAGAAGGFGNNVHDACAEFVAWCLSQNPRPATLSVHSLPGVPWPKSAWDPWDWYEKVMAEIASWEPPPVMVDLDEFLITHRGEVLWPPEKRGRKASSDRQSRSPGSPFPSCWFGQNLGDARPGKHTYNCYPLEELPPLLVSLTGTFHWLRSAPSHDQSIAGNVPRTKQALQQLLVSNSAGLPEEFIKFFRSPTLWRRIRSCTGCYLNLDSASTEIPGGLGRLVRFLSDSQDCKHWHLHIAPCETRHTVVATYFYTGSELAYLPGGRGLPHPRDITTCAGSFEEFLYRFWLENEIKYALNCQGVMPKHGEEYLAHYHSKDRTAVNPGARR
jgi:hypothetical protein